MLVATELIPMVLTITYTISRSITSGWGERGGHITRHRCVLSFLSSCSFSLFLFFFFQSVNHSRRCDEDQQLCVCLCASGYGVSALFICICRASAHSSIHRSLVAMTHRARARPKDDCEFYCRCWCLSSCKWLFVFIGLVVAPLTFVCV